MKPTFNSGQKEDRSHAKSTNFVAQNVNTSHEALYNRHLDTDHGKSYEDGNKVDKSDDDNDGKDVTNDKDVHKCKYNDEFDNEEHVNGSNNFNDGDRVHNTNDENNVNNVSRSNKVSNDNNGTDSIHEDGEQKHYTNTQILHNDDDERHQLASRQTSRYKNSTSFNVMTGGQDEVMAKAKLGILHDFFLNRRNGRSPRHRQGRIYNDST